MITEINAFNRNYKRKPKKFRKLGAPNLEMLDNIDSEEVRQRVEAQEKVKEEVEQEQYSNMAGSSFSLAPFKYNFQDESV